MTGPRRIMIVAPFWGHPQHVGVSRVDRFIRWLSERGVDIVLVRAGGADGVKRPAWGTEVTIRDPLRLYREAGDGASPAGAGRRPSPLRRRLAYAVFCPDPTVVWARRAAGHPLVLGQGRDLAGVLSSSPPESAHLASSVIAARLRTDLVIDLRDGWLDEPLKPNLCASRLRRWREGRREARILRHAGSIFVTSTAWKDLLEERLPFTRGKTVVLTNGYPVADRPDGGNRRGPPGALRLLYAGRLTGSRKLQRAEHLLGPLLAGVRKAGVGGEVVFLGNLEPEDLVAIGRWRPRFEDARWSIEIVPHVPREDMMRRLRQADGLLLLAISQAAIPGKLFEYLPAGRPILAVTPQGSAVWKVGKAIGQVYLADHARPADAESAAAGFVSACASGNFRWELPPDFSEERLGEIFAGRLIPDEGKGHGAEIA
jgi:hypothetical protein